MQRDFVGSALSQAQLRTLTKYGEVGKPGVISIARLD